MPAASRSVAPKSAFSSCAIRRSGGHEEETFEEFSARYTMLLRGYIVLDSADETQQIDPQANPDIPDTRRSSMEYKMFLSFR
jgi:hypothetical protein